MAFKLYYTVYILKGGWLIRKGLRKCYFCKNIFPLNFDYFFHRGSKSKNRDNGFGWICKKCSPIRNRKYIKNNKFLNYKHGAKRRNIIFDLTELEFMSFWQKSCGYCGSELKTIGLDRIDNSKGYLIDNIISCCFSCNAMKGTFTKTEFIEKCRKIIIIASQDN